MRLRFVALEDAADAEAVVVVDVLRAFTTAPWLFRQGADRVLTVDSADRARELRDGLFPEAVLAGEEGGRQVEGFDLGNSPTQVAAVDLSGRTIIQRTSAGTQGLSRCGGSRLLLASSFVVAGATVRLLEDARPQEICFVITGASAGRDGDEDLACAELIAERLTGDDPDPSPFLARVAASDWGKSFGRAPWAPSEDLEAACEVDRFGFALVGTHDPDLRAVELTCT